MRSIRHIFGLIVLLLNSNIYSFAQTEFSFPYSSASWDNQVTPSEAVVWPNDYVTRYELLGDTSINSQSYAKIYKTWTMGYNQIGQCDFTYFIDPVYNLEYIGALRNDGLQRVYFVPIDSLVEILMYDFSIQLDDSFQFHYRTPQPSVITGIVQKVDSILIQDSYRKRIHFGWTDTWIDGIGSFFGLFHTYLEYHTGYEAFELICFKESNLPVYFPDAYCGESWCSLATDISSFQQDTPFLQIYPNPVIDVSRISIDEDCSQINIYDVSGIKVYTYFPDSESIDIRKSDFKQGVYVIEAISINRNVYHQKVVIK
jgi:hypothetical protein